MRFSADRLPGKFSNEVCTVRVFALFALFFAVVFGGLAASERPLHVVTIASSTPAGFKRFVYSCIRNRIHLDVLGFGQPYHHMKKLYYMDKYLETLPEDDLVLFVDSYDIIFLEDMEEIVSRFSKMQVPFLISAERNPYPNVATGSPYKERYPEAATSCRYLNSGSYIGSVKEVRKRVQGGIEFAHSGLTGCDQGLLQLHFIEHPAEYCLDSYCELFLPVFMVSESEVRLENGTITFTETGSHPCIIHANGSSWGPYMAAYRYFSAIHPLEKP